MDIEYSAKGSIMDGSLAQSMPDLMFEIEYEVADYAMTEIQQRFDTVLRHPTGRLRRSVHIVEVGPGLKVKDGEIYGAWIEGVGERNKSSRFKGYRTFRTVAQQVRREAPIIAQVVTDDHLRRYA